MKAWSNCSRKRAIRQRRFSDTRPPSADGHRMRIFAQTPHHRRHDQPMERPDSGQIETAEQVVPPDKRRHRENRALRPFAQIDNDAKIEMPIVKPEDHLPGRGVKNRKVANLLARLSSSQCVVPKGGRSGFEAASEAKSSRAGWRICPGRRRSRLDPYPENPLRTCPANRRREADCIDRQTWRRPQWI
jgi:hypothetical protein